MEGNSEVIMRRAQDHVSFVIDPLDLVVNCLEYWISCLCIASPVNSAMKHISGMKTALMSQRSVFPAPDLWTGHERKRG